MLKVIEFTCNYLPGNDCSGVKIIRNRLQTTPLHKSATVLNVHALLSLLIDYMLTVSVSINSQRTACTCYSYRPASTVTLLQPHENVHTDCCKALTDHSLGVLLFS